MSQSEYAEAQRWFRNLMRRYPHASEQNCWQQAVAVAKHEIPRDLIYLTFDPSE